MGRVKSQVETLIAAATYSASFQTDASGLCAQFDDVILVAHCTAVAGGGAVTLSYQINLALDTTAPDNVPSSTDWVTIDSMTVISGAGVTAKRITAPIGQVFRIDAAITGTSVTFDLKANFGIRGLR